ncbi:MAG: Ig-like domain-containing protein [Clostridiales bacterium]|nr:Ig-like domain-containing protein [Clostridiales bacterium]
MNALEEENNEPVALETEESVNGSESQTESAEEDSLLSDGVFLDSDPTETEDGDLFTSEEGSASSVSDSAAQTISVSITGTFHYDAAYEVLDLVNEERAEAAAQPANSEKSVSVSIDPSLFSGCFSLSSKKEILPVGYSTTVSADLTNPTWSVAYAILDPSMFKWSSSDTSVLTVDSSGKVKARSVGEATITATDSSGELSASLKISTISLDAPSIKSVAAVNNGIKVTWNTVKNAATYIIAYGYQDGNWDIRSYDTVTAGSGSTQTHTILAQDLEDEFTDYYIYVKASDSEGNESEESERVYTSFLSIPVLNSAENTASGVKIQWGSVTGAGKYRVYRKTSGGSWKKLADTTSTSYTDKTAKSGTTYFYTVRCMNSEGNTFTSGYNTTGLSIQYLSCGTISKLTNTSTGIKVTWDKVTGASGYYVYRKTSSGTYKRIKTIAGGDTLTYTDTAVQSKNATTYLYAVRPYSGTTKGYYKSKTTVRLTTPVLSGVTNSSSGKATVKWTAVSGVSGYQIMYSTSSSFSTYTEVKVSGASSVRTVLSDLEKGKTYYVRIRTYKTVSGTVYASGWTGKKSVKISK